MSMSRNWSSFKRSSKGSSSYVRKTAEVRKNPPKKQVMDAYRYSMEQALVRGDHTYAAELQAKLNSL